jgi:hypothetical protein
MITGDFWCHDICETMAKFKNPDGIPLEGVGHQNGIFAWVLIEIDSQPFRLRARTNET